MSSKIVFVDDNPLNIAYKQSIKDSKVIISFIDNGIGIKKEVFQKIFKFGFSTKNRGSGFGLHNCANFIRSQGGEISISSDSDLKGVTIQIQLKQAS